FSCSHNTHFRSQKIQIGSQTHHLSLTPNLFSRPSSVVVDDTFSASGLVKTSALQAVLRRCCQLQEGLCRKNEQTHLIYRKSAKVSLSEISYLRLLMCI